MNSIYKNMPEEKFHELCAIKAEGKYIRSEILREIPENIKANLTEKQYSFTTCYRCKESLRRDEYYRVLRIDD
jgi:hypothetical protein